MNVLNISENIIRLRRERKVTQEELADFIGVTKASVSKWENKQSMPDILLLPQLASFFGVTVDELLGYEAQLSREQIQKEYSNLAADFAQMPFVEVVDKIHRLVHRYYSCYPFLLQVCVLYINHYMLADGKEAQEEFLQEAVTLCEHIIKDCSDVSVNSDAVAMRAMLKLFLGKAEEVIEMLESVTNPYRISGQNDMILIQAYQLIGDTKKARSFTQITMYLHLIALVSSSVQYLILHMENLSLCQETITRVEGVLECYHMEKLHGNITAQFYYQSSLTFASHDKPDQALDMLEKYVATVCQMFSSEHILLHGDEFFDCLDDWIDNLALGAEVPRNKQLIAQSALQALDHPLLAGLKDTERFKRLQRQLTKAIW